MNRVSERQAIQSGRSFGLVYEGMSHAGYLFIQDAPVSREVFAELDLFPRQHLP